MKGRRSQTGRSLLVWLAVDEFFFLAIAPWLLIVPAHFICRSLPRLLSPGASFAVGIVAGALGLAWSLWAVACQWRQGGGTPSLNAPTQRLVVAGPYRLSRNPIQFGALLYIFGLGTLTFSLLTGALAAAVGLAVGVVYIKGVEEKEMAIRFGEDYEMYRSETPFLLPFGRRGKGV